MPNRYIRESCRTSPNLAELSHGAERMFWRLITVADDFGRFEAEHDVLLCQCFPKLLDSVKLTHVKAWLSELVTCQLVTTYVVNRRTYAFFNTWEKHQRTRAQHSKYPSPSSDNICPPMLSNVADLRPTTYDLRERPTTPASPNGFDRFWSAYPKKKAKGDAEKAWKQIKPDSDLLAVILAAIDRAKGSDDWTKDSGKYIPFPATWLRAKRWEDEEVAKRDLPDDFFPFPTNEDGQP